MGEKKSSNIADKMMILSLQKYYHSVNFGCVF